MIRTLLLAVATLTIATTPAFAAPCRDAKGKFAKCHEAKPAHKPCRDAKGHFKKCK